VNHEPVLLREAVDALGVERRPEGIFVDATFGRGGHARQILARLRPRGRLIALDRDDQAIAAAREIGDPRLVAIHARFGRLREVVLDRGIGRLDGVLLDLGVSSPQIDDPRRGFSFRGDGPLDMRMDTSGGETAAQWLARASEAELRRVIKNYGDERFAKQIAAQIVAARQRRPLARTRELADLVGATVRTREPGQDPATRTFQALRIHVNQELEELSLVLPQALELLDAGGRIVVISFHSLEDRAVKNFFRDQSRPGRLPERLPVRAAELPAAKLRLLGKPIRPGEAETRRNPRARSAVMRVAERLA
jgi:16S rRNA (cytosine1402-N4)-methyltransferase